MAFNLYGSCSREAAPPLPWAPALEGGSGHPQVMLIDKNGIVRTLLPKAGVSPAAGADFLPKWWRDDLADTAFRAAFVAGARVGR